MSKAHLVASRTDDAWLLLMCGGRFASTLIYMVYPACLPRLMSAWEMNAVQAGTVQAAFNAGHALSLLGVSWLSDHYGPRRVLLVSAWAGGAMSLAFGLFARSFGEAVVLLGLVGLTIGGSYTPAIMLASARYATAKRGRAVGSLLASASLGYAASLLLSGIGLATGGYKAAFLLCGVGPLIGAFVFSVTLRSTSEVPYEQAQEGLPRRWIDRSACLLITGYVGHSWELLGLWAWTPAFVSAAAAAAGMSGAAATATGAWAIGLLHVTGFLASLVAGRLSDAFGRRAIIMLFASLGMMTSFAIGWSHGSSLIIVIFICMVYGFVAVADSPVLSAALTEAVPPRVLGRVLAIRSLLGFGAGALAAVTFGAVIDAVDGPGSSLSWVLAFSTLGLGGVLAVVCAKRLPKGRT